jgi:hypothetical protein
MSSVEGTSEMETVALYFPAMIPPDAWIKRNLLLFDSTSSVIPRGIEISNPTLRWLQERFLWTPSYADDLNTPQYLNDLEVTLRHFAQDGDHLIAHGQRPPARLVRRLFIGKLLQAVEGVLQETGLGHLERRSYPYLLVHEAVWDAVLSITAKYLSEANLSVVRRLVPTTDLPRSARFAYEDVQDAPTSISAIEVILDGLVPTPGEDVSFDDVVAFREAYADEFIVFRYHIDKLAERVRTSENPLEAFRLGRQAVAASLTPIKSAALSRRMSIRMGKMSAFVFLGFVTHLADPASARWLLGEMGAVATAGVMGYVLRGPATSSDRPFSYLHEAAVHFGRGAIQA